MRVTDKKYCVYAHIAPDGKIYIGITGVSPEKRWKHGEGYSGQPFYYVMQKYGGFDVFSHLILVDNCTEKEALSFEEAFIKEYDTTNPEHGFNTAYKSYSRVPSYPSILCLETGEIFSSTGSLARKLHIHWRTIKPVLHWEKLTLACHILHENRSGNSYTIKTMYCHFCYLDEIKDNTEFYRIKKIAQLERVHKRYRSLLRRFLDDDGQPVPQIYRLIKVLRPDRVYLRYRSWLDKKQKRRIDEAN